MSFLDTAVGALAILTFVTLLVAMGFLVLAHKRARATLFTDAGWKGAFLVMVILYLGFVADNAGLLGGEEAVYHLAEVTAGFLVACFFLLLGIYLWRYSTRGADIVIVSPDFLVALRDRTQAMYGDGPSRFITYAVAKESAHKAIARQIGSGLASTAYVWKRLPYLFRLMGYGRLRYIERRPREELRLEVRGTFETTYSGSKGGCGLTRGYLAGLGEALEPGMTCEAEETHCAGDHGDGRCEFVLRWFPIDETAQVTLKLPSEAK
jgi:predicted hydrocarbon binding protein